MVARWLQQKKAKIKRGRRAWAKPFSMKNTGPEKHPGFVNEKGDFVEIGFGSRSKVAKTTFDHYLLVKHKFNPNSNEALYSRTGGLHSDLAQTQEIVLAKRVQSRGNAGSLQGETKYVYSVMAKKDNYELRLYMNGDSCFFYSERKTALERVYKRSVEYDARHRAVDDFKHDRILWDTTDRRPLIEPSE